MTCETTHIVLHKLCGVAACVGTACSDSTHIVCLYYVARSLALQGMGSFTVSFLLAPLASNAAELVAAYNSSLKKTKSSISLSLATLQVDDCGNGDQHALEEIGTAKVLRT